MDEKTGYLEEAPGKSSSTRLMAMVSLVAAVAFGFLAVLRPDPAGNAAYVTTIFLVAAFGGKVGQKFAEQAKAAA